MAYLLASDRNYKGRTHPLLVIVSLRSPVNSLRLVTQTELVWCFPVLPSSSVLTTCLNRAQGENTHLTYQGLLQLWIVQPRVSFSRARPPPPATLVCCLTCRGYLLYFTFLSQIIRYVDQWSIPSLFSPGLTNIKSCFKTGGVHCLVRQTTSATAFPHWVWYTRPFHHRAKITTYIVLRKYF